MSKSYFDSFYRPEIDGLRDLLNRFSDRKIIFVLENPTLNFDPRSCNTRRPLKHISYYISNQEKNYSRCSIQKTYDSEIYSNYISKVKKLLEDYSNVKIVDPRDFLCKAKECFAMIGGRIIYSDKNHLNINGSYVQGKQISEAFKFFLE